MSTFICPAPLVSYSGSSSSESTTYDVSDNCAIPCPSLDLNSSQWTLLNNVIIYIAGIACCLCFAVLLIYARDFRRYYIRIMFIAGFMLNALILCSFAISNRNNDLVCDGEAHYINKGSFCVLQSASNIWLLLWTHSWSAIMSYDTYLHVTLTYKSEHAPMLRRYYTVIGLTIPSIFTAISLAFGALGFDYQANIPICFFLISEFGWAFWVCFVLPFYSLLFISLSFTLATSWRIHQVFISSGYYQSDYQLVVSKLSEPLQPNSFTRQYVDAPYDSDPSIISSDSDRSRNHDRVSINLHSSSFDEASRLFDADSSGPSRNVDSTADGSQQSSISSASLVHSVIQANDPAPILGTLAQPLSFSQQQQLQAQQQLQQVRHQFQGLHAHSNRVKVASSSTSETGSDDYISLPGLSHTPVEETTSGTRSSAFANFFKKHPSTASAPAHRDASQHSSASSTNEDSQPLTTPPDSPRQSHPSHSPNLVRSPLSARHEPSSALLATHVFPFPTLDSPRSSILDVEEEEDDDDDDEVGVHSKQSIYALMGATAEQSTPGDASPQCNSWACCFCAASKPSNTARRTADPRRSDSLCLLLNAIWHYNGRAILFVTLCGLTTLTLLPLVINLYYSEFGVFENSAEKYLACLVNASVTSVDQTQVAVDERALNNCDSHPKKIPNIFILSSIMAWTAGYGIAPALVFGILGHVNDWLFSLCQVGHTNSVNSRRRDINI